MRINSNIINMYPEDTQVVYIDYTKSNRPLRYRTLASCDDFPKVVKFLYQVYPDARVHACGIRQFLMSHPNG